MLQSRVRKSSDGMGGGHGMAQPELKRTLDLVEPATAGSDAPQTAKQTPDNTAVTRPSPELPPYYDDALQDAERLMKYAAEIGVDVDDDIRNDILQARADTGLPSNEQVANLLTALTKLAARLRPVTAESLKACSGEEQYTVHSYWKWAACLAAIIVPFSIASFVTSAISDAIRKDIVTANELAVKLTAQLRPPQAPSPAATPAVATAAQPASALPAGLTVVDVVTELQQFASIIRAVDGRARQLNAFVFHIEQDPYFDIRQNREALHTKFQLPAGLPNLAEASDDRIRVYQDVRYFAQSLLDDVSFFYGAITTCLLPVLYALLGTCAYLLRSFEEQMRTKTFIPSLANSARFLIAGIGGAVVGLFNNFTITQGASIPPLAIAFLVGYAVDVFFSFLEGLLQAFTKTRSSVSSEASTPLSGGKA
jgi:hypothetical protein